MCARCRPIYTAIRRLRHELVPQRARTPGRRRLVILPLPKASSATERLLDEIFAALDQRTATIPECRFRP
ncbi:hypothetical protein QWJ26_17555 [Streptomyces sp. CSDS2]|uniref:hypothetical protein n=1 Tax=Streptomyces sp. CSDS2 TaxID=3055051 RepID=UPI0025B1C7A5|nr:hypothetical protein [Streptomyces sp. CSDS2]MDN3261587.1 hypothetical protein [Streptomyces sp. CSDS2]